MSFSLLLAVVTLWGLLAAATYICSKITSKPGFSFELFVKVENRSSGREAQTGRPAPRARRENTGTAAPAVAGGPLLG